MMGDGVAARRMRNRREGISSAGFGAGEGRCHQTKKMDNSTTETAMYRRFWETFRFMDGSFLVEGRKDGWFVFLERLDVQSRSR